SGRTGYSIPVTPVSRLISLRSNRKTISRAVTRFRSAIVRAGVAEAGSMGCLDCFSHQLPASLRQWSQAAPRQIPQAFVVIAGVKKNHAIACGCVVKGRPRIFVDD